MTTASKLLLTCALAINGIGVPLGGCNSTGSDSGTRVDPTVYDKVDNRQEPYQYPNQDFAARVQDFAVALMKPSNVDESDPNNIRFPVESLGDYHDLCDGERFTDQPTAAFCSGTLIAPDLVLTAGHCIRDDDDPYESEKSCSKMRLVFGYTSVKGPDGKPVLSRVTNRDVFGCAEVLVREDGRSADYGIIRLDRPARGHQPATQREAGSLAVGSALVAAGYPSGVPLKIADGAKVTENRSGLLDFFYTRLDVFLHNSGSGVFLQETGELVGIAVRRRPHDYETDEADQCKRVRVCNEDTLRACSVDVSYAFWAPAVLTCGDDVCDETENSVSCAEDCSTRCGDDICNGDENARSCSEDCGLCGNGICERSESDSGSCCGDCNDCSEGKICVEDNPFSSTWSFDHVCIPDPGPGSTCDDPIAIPASGTQRISGSTEKAFSSLSGSCDGEYGSDRIYTFTLEDPMQIDAQVTVERQGPVIYLRSDCADSASELACGSAPSPTNDLRGGVSLQTRLGPGTYYLIVDGQSTGGFDYELKVRFSADKG